MALCGGESRFVVQKTGFHARTLGWKIHFYFFIWLRKYRRTTGWYRFWLLHKKSRIWSNKQASRITQLLCLGIHFKSWKFMKSKIYYYSLPDLDFLWSNFFHHRPDQKRNNASSTGFFSVSSLHGNLSNPFVAFNGRYRLMNPDFSHA